jgi:uncharacterized protein (DUF2164 family)
LSDIKFTKEEKEILVQKVKTYFKEELSQEIGRFDADFLIDFFSKELGAYFYNRGIYDSQALLAKRVEEIKESLYELEKPTDFIK